MTKIPPEVIEYVESCMENFEYSDNMRIADMEDKDSLAYYEEIRRGGCCGFVDYQVFHWSGKKYQFGFNYGH